MKLNLENVPLFADVSADDRESLTQAVRFERIRQGERLFNIGDGSEALYIIDIGWAKLLDADGMVVANLGPGNMFGETEVLTGRPRELQAVAATDMSVWVLNAGDLDRLVSESLDFGLALSKAFGSRVGQLTRYLAEERLKPVPFFFELDYEGLAEAANKLTLERYTRGSFLFHRGGWARALFMLESGEINLVMSDPGTAIETFPLLPGAVVGEIALLTGKPYTFTAEVEADATVWALGRDDFESLCDRYPSIRLILSRSMAMSPHSYDSGTALEHLRAIPLFADLPDSALKAVTQRLILRHVPAGELVYAEGSPGEAMYIVDGGEVEAISSAGPEREAMAHLHDGEYFGETALLTGRSRTSAVRAVVHTNLWALYRSDFDELMVRYPAIRQSLNRTLGRELSEAGRRPVIIEGEPVVPVERRTPVEPAPRAAQPSPMPAARVSQSEPRSTSRRAEEPGSRRETYADPSGWTDRTDARRHARGDAADGAPEEDARPSRAESAKSSPRNERTPHEPVTYARDQKTEEFRPPAVEPDAVPSRYRDAFVRPAPAQKAPVARGEDGTGRSEEQPVRPEPAAREERPAGSRSNANRLQQTIAQEPVPAAKPRSGAMPDSGAGASRSGTARQQTTAQEPVPAAKIRPDSESDDDQPHGPKRLARWFASLSIQGKLRLVGLLLIFIWFVCIVPPAFVIKSSNVSIRGALSGLVAGSPPPAMGEEPPPAEPPGGDQAVEEPPAAVDAPADEAVAAPTDTPVPTDTPAPSPTPAPTDTPPPPTNTPAPTATATVAPTATPNNSGVVQAAVAWVRVGPSANFKALAKLSSGDKVSLLGRDADGVWVQIKTADGTEGWAEARYIETAAKVEALALVESPNTPTPKATAKPAVSPSPTGPTETPTTAASPTPAIKYTAPVQTKPNDGDAVSNGPLAKNYLEWEDMKLQADEFYNVTIVYKVNGVDSYFGDASGTEPRYLLPEGLYHSGDQNWYEWRVVVRKVTSTSADGKPDGPAISPESGLRRFRWD